VMQRTPTTTLLDAWARRCDAQRRLADDFRETETHIVAPILGERGAHQFTRQCTREKRDPTVIQPGECVTASDKPLGTHHDDVHATTLRSWNHEHT